MNAFISRHIPASDTNWISDGQSTERNQNRFSLSRLSNPPIRNETALRCQSANKVNIKKLSHNKREHLIPRTNKKVITFFFLIADTNQIIFPYQQQK